MSESSVAVILGSAFDVGADEAGWRLVPEVFRTPFGEAVLHRVEAPAREDGVGTWALLRHGRPHGLLPNQINYRANAWALGEVGCGALLVTSSVGVLTAELPLNVPMWVEDIITLDNRLPGGEACTMFVAPSEAHGHLVLQGPLSAPSVRQELERVAPIELEPLGRGVVFGYVGGPRTKTPAENRMWATLGAEVNSMTVAPELILAAELGIAAGALVVGHKRSLDQPADEALDARGVTASLQDARGAMTRWIEAWLCRARPVSCPHHLYRFNRL